MLLTLNQIVFQFIHKFSGHSELLDGTAIFFSEYLPYLLIAAFLILVYYQSRRRLKLFLFCEGALAVILARGIVEEVFHLFIRESRPFSFYNISPLIPESGWSFPSGHMLWFFALSMTVWYVNRRWGVAFFILSALMGIARIYAGVHWPIDVVGGAVLGVLCAMLIHQLLADTRKQLG